MEICKLFLRVSSRLTKWRQQICKSSLLCDYLSDGSDKGEWDISYATGAWGC